MDKMKAMISKPAPAREEERKQEARPQVADESADFGYSSEGLESLAEAPAEAKPQGALEIQARFVMLRDNTVVLELVVPEPGLEFELETAMAVVRLADGRQVTAKIVIDRSTRPGSYAAGVVLRITLDLGGEQASSADECWVVTRTATLRAKA